MDRVCEKCGATFKATPATVRKGGARWCSIKCYGSMIEASARKKQDFWAKVDKSLGEESCWEWTGALSKLEYGMVRYKGKTKSAHQIAFLLSGGQICEGQVIRHKCDNRKCCNPGHLVVGTQLHNVRDRMERNPPKDEKWRMKLSDEQVADIRRSSGTLRSIAAHYAVSVALVSQIKTFKNRKNAA